MGKASVHEHVGHQLVDVEVLRQEEVQSQHVVKVYAVHFQHLIQQESDDIND